MKKKAIIIISLIVGIAGAMGLMAGFALARSSYDTNTTTGPTVISYQGEVQVGGEPFTGTGYFKFAFVNAAGSYNYWTNDGTNLGAGGDEPTDAVPLDVVDGLFSVLLGNTNLTNMNEPLTASVFADRGRRLHIWFDPDGVGPYTDLGLTVIAAVPYAFNAETLDGKDGAYYDQHYAHVVAVAKSGGDYTSVQAAIDSISDATPEDPYLVWVGPGTYSETVVMKPYVHLQGSGQDVTIISSTVGGGDGDYPIQATLVLTDRVSLRDLTVKNGGTDQKNAAILATGNMTDTLVADVTAHAFGEGSSVYGIYLYGFGSDFRITFLNVTGNAENGENFTVGLMADYVDQLLLRGGSYYGKGGDTFSIGINQVTGYLRAENIISSAEGGSGKNVGLFATGGAKVTIIGGEFIGQNGDKAIGLEANFGGFLNANGIRSIGYDGTTNRGVWVHDSGAGCQINNSVLEGEDYPVYFSSDVLSTIAHTRLIGGEPFHNSSLSCIAVSRGITFTVGLDCP